MKEITVAIARSLWKYDPESGLIMWKVRVHPRLCVGDVAGTIGSYGYRVITLDGKKYMAARLAWLLMTGDWPSVEIDHRDCDRANDKWNNLREATSAQNKRNMRLRKDNALGIKGVHIDRLGKYVAKINGRYLGRYSSCKEARAVYAAAAAELHGEFRRAA